jgi:hypothetical protein
MLNFYACIYYNYKLFNLTMLRINYCLLYAWSWLDQSSWLITGFVTRLTRRVPLVEQELLTFPEHLSSSPVFSEFRVTRFLVLYVCFVDRCLSFCTYFLAIVLSVLLRYTDSDCPFGNFKLFFWTVDSVS